MYIDLQIQREPDGYAKTVLTFRDKPGPAMVQISLRKTANETKETFPTEA